MEPKKSILQIIDFDKFSNDCEWQFIAENEDYGNNPQCRLRERRNLDDRECEDCKCENCETTNLLHLKKYDMDLYREWVEIIEESGHKVNKFMWAPGNDEFSMDLNFFFTEYNYVLISREVSK